MKKAFRHSPVKKTAAKRNELKAPKKRVAKPVQPGKQQKLGKLTAPIFNTRYAGVPYTYIRPFDPVWPTDEPES
jgi:hypothetical protein